MTLELLTKYGWLIALVLQGFIAWIGWSIKERFVTRKDYEEDKKQLDGLVSRVKRVEEMLEDLPDQSEMHDLSMALEKLSGKMGGLMERVEAAYRNQDRYERVLNRIEDFLLTNKGA